MVLATKNSQRKWRESTLQKKIILLLYAGLALGLTRNPNQYFRVVREVSKEWGKINKSSFERSIGSLYKSKLVSTKDNHDGTLSLVLTKEGQKIAVMYDIETVGIKTPANWDRKWRIVMFDVPEPLKRVRDILRTHFKNMGFYEFQKSVFVHPHPCEKEIEYIIKFYDARKFVRYIVATEIDNSRELCRHFNVS